MEAKVDAGVAKAVARAESGVVLCFMDHEATSKETVDAGKDENGALSTRWIPGPVRHMKVVKDEAAHRQIYEKVRAISLFVMKLPMYLICESLADVSGARLHEGFRAELVGDPVGLVANGLEGYMEVLRAGLYDEFCEDTDPGKASGLSGIRR